MAPLTQTNPYLRRPSVRNRMLRRNAVESSIFEGARGLRQGQPSHRMLSAARASASAKKRTNRS